MSEKSSNIYGWRIILIVIIAIAILFGISFLPLNEYSGGVVKDFNLLSDILPDGNIDEELVDSVGESIAHSDVEPELLKAMVQEEKREIDTTQVAYDNTPVIAIQPATDGELVIIEDYTESGAGLAKLRKSLSSEAHSRIAVIGDSYIEGDIFTQNLREMLQSEYGGAGVGYVNMHSEFPGFRRSILQGGSGWKEYSVKNKHNKDYITLTQHYYVPKQKATSTYKGANKIKHTDSWDKSQFIFISPNNTEILTRTTDEWVSHAVTGSTELQAIEYDGVTSRFEVCTSDPSVIGIGVWLTDSAGVSLDCMSSRGFSGLTLSAVAPDITDQLSKYIDYDLIILEFGINAMSPRQKNFNAYAGKMIDVVNHLRVCYPETDILLMGIGDRGERRNGEVHSVISAPYLVDAQRDVARKSKCLFWDTRLAMGGEDAVVEWSRKGDINKDYIHMSHKGGERLAKLFFDAIQQNLNK
ncbi:MAG: hypothetical protein K2M94_08505 [Paramuribaculum sp.]|nr:hypothetical protein [Paramuribaculum sp.]